MCRPVPPLQAVLVSGNSAASPALEAAGLGTFEYCATTGRLAASDRAMRHLGFAADGEVTCEALLRAVHREDRCAVRRRAQELLRSEGGEFAVEFRTAGAADGATRWILCQGRTFADAAHLPTRIAGVTWDITERKEAGQLQARREEEFFREQKLATAARLAAGVAHDFNNLLTVINGYAAMLLAEAPPGELRNGLTEIGMAGDRAAALGRQLLVFSRNGSAQPALVDLNNVVRDAGAAIRQTANEGLRLEISLSPAPASVVADPAHLRQALLQLAANAREAMDESGTLRIETGAEGSEGSAPAAVWLRVTDTGRGMSAEVQSHLFEPFFTTKTSGKGTGMGLAMVYGIVKQAGGAIDVASQAGHGTTVTVRLPRAPQPAAHETPHASCAPAPGGETILVVDDEEAMRKVAARLLRACGYRILEAADAGQALARATEQGPIDLLLTDLVMPGTSGIELAGQLKEIHPALKVLLMSGSENAAAQRDQLGPDDGYLPKPFSPHGLAAKVREVLDGSAGSAG